jgi:chromatin remodeling complex protein RSC6
MPSKSTVPKKVAKTTAPKKEKPTKTTAPKKAPKKAPVQKTVAKSAPKKTAPKKAPKTAPKKVAEKPTSIVETAAPVVAAPAPATLEAPVSTTPSDFQVVLGELDSALAVIKSLRQRVAKLDKQVQREAKAAAKKGTRKKRVVDPNAEPSGFAKPGPVSSELRSFLGLGPDELIARTAVTQRINKYCKDNSLQIPTDKRHIKPDAPLRKLLKIGPKDDLTFFNLQKYMKIHFPNKEGVYPVV